jgi:FtsH-like protein
MEIKRGHQIHFWYIIAAFVGVMLIQSLLFQPTHIKTIPNSEFQHFAAQGKVKDLVVGPTQITGTFNEPADKNVPHFATNRVDPALAETLARDKLTFSGEAGPWAPINRPQRADARAWLRARLDVPGPADGRRTGDGAAARCQSARARPRPSSRRTSRRPADCLVQHDAGD